MSVTLNGRGLGLCLGSGVVMEGFPNEDILVFNPERRVKSRETRKQAGGNCFGKSEEHGFQ